MKSPKIYAANDFPKYLPKLNTLYDDLFSGGKGFRSKFVSMVGRHVSLDDSQLQLLCQTIEFIHNASLLHDDLVDRAHLRRNKTTAWLKYSPEYAVLAGDYLLARVMVNLSSYGNLTLIHYTSEMISDLLEGEWIQDTLIKDWNLSLPQLDRVHDLKTASLFKWCLRAPFIMAGYDNKTLHGLLTDLGSILGLLFQRSDDLLDYDVRNYENKAVLGDLKSGYLNSFAVYLLVGFDSMAFRQRFVQCQSLPELIEVVGENHFNNRLAEFDRMNIELIEVYGHKLELIKTYLPADGEGLTNDLRELAPLLYWRRK